MKPPAHRTQVRVLSTCSRVIRGYEACFTSGFDCMLKQLLHRHHARHSTLFVEIVQRSAYRANSHAVKPRSEASLVHYTYQHWSWYVGECVECACSVLYEGGTTSVVRHVQKGSRHLTAIPFCTEGKQKAMYVCVPILNGHQNNNRHSVRTETERPAVFLMSKEAFKRVLRSSFPAAAGRISISSAMTP